ncbi:MAG: 1,4-alpha-glucan branching protein GlgB [Verrucomicrobiales bacterium]
MTTQVKQKKGRKTEEDFQKNLPSPAQGKTRLYERLGGRLIEDGSARFAVWAPNAESVSVIGDFNDWNTTANPLTNNGEAIWTLEVNGVQEGAVYKYCIQPKGGGAALFKLDPVGFATAHSGHVSQLTRLEYTWNDQAWMENRKLRINPKAPIAIYETHLGSWMRVPEDGNRWLTYREIAPKLAEYVKKMGFTHVEFLPLMEHPFYGSWGYQCTGYFSPTSRYGSPADLMFLVDYLHQQEIGVIFDWVPSHFPVDEHGLSRFDGSALYEYEDPKLGFNPEWQSAVFDYQKPQVRQFLTHSALFWLDKYHADGIRVDAVASMLYRDHARKPGEWIPNAEGGNENWEAISFLRELNDTVRAEFPDVAMIAEESTAWPNATHSVSEKGLGFHYKWDLGYQFDILKYFSKDYAIRKSYHGQLTFRGLYAHKERYILPFSHDEVKQQSLLSQMPGDGWRRFASLRVLLGYTYFQPGKKLLFMGNEFAQWQRWNHDTSLDWHLLDDEFHRKFQTWVAHLNNFYRSNSAAHSGDHSPWGFEWVDLHSAEQSVISWLRKNEYADDETLLGVFNFTPNPQFNFRMGAPASGKWEEILNSDSQIYGGSGHGNLGVVQASPFGRHGQPFSLTITLPPLAAVFFKPLK